VKPPNWSATRRTTNRMGVTAQRTVDAATADIQKEREQWP
jgi:hypothetical protein